MKNDITNPSAFTSNEIKINNQTKHTYMEVESSKIKDVNQHWPRRGGIIDNDGNCIKKNVLVHLDDVPTIVLFGQSEYVMDEEYDLKTIWALKAFLPFTKDENYDQLRANIQENGIINPLLYTITENGDKLLIDGHTRLCIATDLGISEDRIKTVEVPIKFQSIDEIKVWILEHQSQRRIISTKQRIELVLPLRETIAAMAKRNNSIGGSEKEVGEEVHTNARLAKIAGVGVSTITRYLAKNGLSEKRPKKQKAKEPASDEVTNDNKPLRYSIIEDAVRAMDNGQIDVLLVVKTPGQIKSIASESIRLGYILQEDAMVGWANQESAKEAA